jgi:hypothetical protein
MSEAIVGEEESISAAAEISRNQASVQQGMPVEPQD